jgi:hypothetical protein
MSEGRFERERQLRAREARPDTIRLSDWGRYYPCADCGAALKFPQKLGQCGACWTKAQPYRYAEGSPSDWRPDRRERLVLLASALVLTSAILIEWVIA